MDEFLAVGIAQVESEAANISVNLEKAGEAIIEAKKKGARIVCFPELFPSGYCLEELGEEILSFYRRNYALILRFFAEAACTAQIYIVLPTGIPKGADTIENGLICFDPSGNMAGVHSKYHLWANEKKYFSHGDDTLFLRVGSVNTSFAICYDLGFPEVCRYLGQRAMVIFAPAAWDISGFRLWELNLSQRAAENTLFMVGINAVGTFKGTRLFGQSMICGPTGDILFKLPMDREKVDVFTINLAAVEKARQILPYMKDRRSDLYAKWFSSNQKE